MSVRLYVGNLPEDVNRQDLEAVFTPSEEVVSLKLITDRKTGKCRGFGFLTVATPEAADRFIEQYNNISYQETTLRIELAQPKAKSDRPEGEVVEGEAAPTPAPVLILASPPEGVPVRAAAERAAVIRPPIRKANRSERQAAESSGSRRRENPANPAPRTERERPPISDDASQPDPRWAEALRNIKQQLTAKA